jgi:hypothetical protein
MRTPIAAAVLAAGILVGATAGAFFGGPGLASATATDAGGPITSWIEDALDPLVEDHTITRPQADAVVDALEEARPAHHHRGAGRFDRGDRPGRADRGLDAATDLFGLTPSELRAALRDGRTLAEIAEANGVSAEQLVSTLVEAHEERLAGAVADARVDEERAEEIRARLEERITEMVNGEHPAGGQREHLRTRL